MALAWASISAGVRGPSENCLPTSRKVAPIISPANCSVAGARGPDLARFRRVAIQRRGVVERHPHVGFLALREDEGVHHLAQARGRRIAAVLEDRAQHTGACFRSSFQAVFFTDSADSRDVADGSALAIKAAIRRAVSVDGAGA